MANWNEFRNRFSDDLTSARTNKERTVQKQRLVDAKGPVLWDDLLKEANSAVTVVNNGLTLVGPHPVDNPDGFAILYNREGEQRKASITFQRNVHAITVNVNNGNRSQQDRFSIVAEDDGGVAFSAGGSTYTPEKLVAQILGKLL
jgi:hypothetical protein